MFKHGPPGHFFLAALTLVLLIQNPIAAQEARRSEIDSLKARVQELERLVRQLQDKLRAPEPESPQAPPAPAPRAEDQLLQELAAELGETQKPAPAPPTPPLPQLPGGSRGIFQNMNPNIGVIGNFLGSKLIDREHEEDGFTLNEAEFSFQMVIDPFASSNVFVAVVPPEEAIELEEAYITLLSLPGSLQGRVGHFRPPFGKLNLTHPPETPFADGTSLVYRNFFGEEGLAETGLMINYLIPNPWDLFLEASVGAFDGDNNVSFNGDASSDLLYLGHLKSFFDLSENNSVELGFSAATGKNDPKGEHSTNLVGADLIYRWKPLRLSKYKSFTLQSEILYSNRNGPSGEVNSWGLFTFAEYQLSKRWFLGGRFDYSEFPTRTREHEVGYSAILTFWPSEFQTLRLQVRHLSRNFGEEDTALFLQWVFITGAHGAHAF